MESVKLIQWAIPFFFLLIGIEVIYCLWRRQDHYDLHDSIADLSCGILQQVGGFFMVALYLMAYLYFYELRLFDLPNNPLVWVACFLGVDLAYYWFHRSAHRINLLWGGHAPHHQSEEYNLTVALRQGFFSEPIATLFYLPLAVLGFHPLLFLICRELNTIYQFWIHTRSIGKLGWFESIFNTPSHHRVHHGVNPKYIDRNHAGVLIIWDKLFGSFQEEEEEPVYGVVTPMRSWNPLKANLDHWSQLARTSAQLPRWRDRFLIWWMPPGWMPDRPEPEIPEVSAATTVKYRTPQSRGFTLYIVTQFLLTLGLALYFLELDKTPGAVNISMGLMVALGLVSISGLQERKRWALGVESLRWLLMAAGALLLFQFSWPGWVGFGVAAAMLLWLGWGQRSWLNPSAATALLESPVEAAREPSMDEAQAA